MTFTERLNQGLGEREREALEKFKAAERGNIFGTELEFQALSKEQEAWRASVDKDIKERSDDGREERSPE